MNFAFQMMKFCIQYDEFWESGLPLAGKVVYVSRNPKDACVSMFHHTRAIDSFTYDGTFGDFIELFLQGGVEHGSWWHHHRRWCQICI